MKPHVMRSVSGAKVIAMTRVADLDRDNGAGDLEMPSFKKATIGFMGSIAFLYSVAFFLSAVV